MAEQSLREEDQGDDEEPVGDQVLVITSYSIHYTKLYELAARDPHPHALADEAVGKAVDARIGGDAAIGDLRVDQGDLAGARAAAGEVVGVDAHRVARLEQARVALSYNFV